MSHLRRCVALYGARVEQVLFHSVYVQVTVAGGQGIAECGTGWEALSCVKITATAVALRKNLEITDLTSGRILAAQVLGTPDSRSTALWNGLLTTCRNNKVFS